MSTVVNITRKAVDLKNEKTKMENTTRSVKMESKLNLDLPTILEYNIKGQEPESSTSESSLSSISSFDSSDQDCDDGNLRISVTNVFNSTSIPSTAPVTSLNRNMFAFTRSISALNTMSFSMGVLRAKNAFKKKLSQDKFVTPADYQAEGNRQWQNIAGGYKVTLSLAGLDFSELCSDETDTPIKNVRANLPFSHLNRGIPPPPAPPPHPSNQLPSSGNLPPPPPPPPPSSVPLPPPPPPNMKTTPPPPLSMFCGPPPPPPPPKLSGFGPPPPPRPPLTMKLDENCRSVHRSKSHAITKPPQKLVKLHWRPIPPHSLKNTIWQDLPQVSWDKSHLETLFTIEEKTRRSSIESLSKAKELLVLDSKRSNQINIGIKNLPSMSKLKVIIEEMDDKIITREGVEKLQSLMPCEEEISAIKEAQKENSEIPLGTAEQFLLIMNSISGLECRLKLWAFKVDFKAMEKDICEPLKSLKDGMKKVKKSKTFAKLLSLTLEVGNVLNRSHIEAFQLDYLAKLSWVKDTVAKKTLLYHMTRELVLNDPQVGDLSSDFEDLVVVTRNDYEQLKTNLKGMEDECINSLGYMKLSARYNSDTHDLVSMFLTNAAERIMSMKTVIKLVMTEYSKFLSWVGMPAHLHKDYPPSKTAAILVDFAREASEMRNIVATEIGKENNRKEKVKSLDGAKSSSKKNTHKSHKIRTAGKSIDDKKMSPNPRADGLEAFLDAAAVDLKSKRRRSKKINLEDFEFSTM